MYEPSLASVLSTVSMSGIESVRYWNGSSIKGTAVTLYTAAGSPTFSATA